MHWFAAGIEASVAEPGDRSIREPRSEEMRHHTPPIRYSCHGSYFAVHVCTLDQLTQPVRGHEVNVVGIGEFDELPLVQGRKTTADRFNGDAEIVGNVGANRKTRWT